MTPTIATSTPAAVEQAVRIHLRYTNPAGHFDNAGRWYPDTACDCCAGIRNPSRGWPYSLLTHCRTIPHLAAEFGLDARELRRAVKAAQAAN